MSAPVTDSRSLEPVEGSPEPVEGPPGRPADVALGSVDQIPFGEGRTFTVDGDQIAVFRLRDGRVRAVSAVCPHKGGPIADGQTDANVVLCPLHLHAFELDSGRCLTGADSLRSYPVRVHQDQLVLTR